jgi:PadR family transcriptional regulator, regulatory protein PadR
MPNFIRYSMDSKIIKGSLTTIILKLLEDNSRMYGYEMTKAVKERSKDKMQLTEAALYPALHKLVEEGLLDTTTEMVDGRMRKYYSLTKKGKKETDLKIEALKNALESLQNILNPNIANG